MLPAAGLGLAPPGQRGGQQSTTPLCLSTPSPLTTCGHYVPPSQGPQRLQGGASVSSHVDRFKRCVPTANSRHHEGLQVRTTKVASSAALDLAPPARPSASSGSHGHINGKESHDLVVDSTLNGNPHGQRTALPTAAAAVLLPPPPPHGGLRVQHGNADAVSASQQQAYEFQTDHATLNGASRRKAQVQLGGLGVSLTYEDEVPAQQQAFGSQAEQHAAHESHSRPLEAYVPPGPPSSSTESEQQERARRLRAGHTRQRHKGGPGGVAGGARNGMAASQAADVQSLASADVHTGDLRGHAGSQQPSGSGLSAADMASALTWKSQPHRRNLGLHHMQFHTKKSAGATLSDQAHGVMSQAGAPGAGAGEQCSTQRTSQWAQQQQRQQQPQGEQQQAPRRNKRSSKSASPAGAQSSEHQQHHVQQHPVLAPLHTRMAIASKMSAETQPYALWAALREYGQAGALDAVCISAAAMRMVRMLCRGDKPGVKPVRGPTTRVLVARQRRFSHGAGAGVRDELQRMAHATAKHSSSSAAEVLSRPDSRTDIELMMPPKKRHQFAADICTAVRMYRSTFRAREVANVVYAISRLRRRHHLLGASSAAEQMLLDLCNELLQQDVASINASASFSDGAPLGSWRMGELAMMMWGLGYSGLGYKQLPGGFLDAVFTLTQPLLATAKPHEISSLLWALACMRAPGLPDSWAHALWQCTAQQLAAGSWAPHEIGTLSWSLGSLGVSAPAAWRRLVARTAMRCSRLAQPLALATTLYGLSRQAAHAARTAAEAAAASASTLQLPSMAWQGTGSAVLGLLSTATAGSTQQGSGSAAALCTEPGIHGLVPSVGQAAHVKRLQPAATNTSGTASNGDAGVPSGAGAGAGVSAVVEAMQAAGISLETAMAGSGLPRNWVKLYLGILAKQTQRLSSSDCINVLAALYTLARLRVGQYMHFMDMHAEAGGGGGGGGITSEDEASAPAPAHPGSATKLRDANSSSGSSSSSMPARAVNAPSTASQSASDAPVLLRPRRTIRPVALGSVSGMAGSYSPSGGVAGSRGEGAGAGAGAGSLDDGDGRYIQCAGLTVPRSLLHDVAERMQGVARRLTHEQLLCAALYLQALGASPQIQRTLPAPVRTVAWQQGAQPGQPAFASSSSSNASATCTNLPGGWLVWWLDEVRPRLADMWWKELALMMQVLAGWRLRPEGPLLVELMSGVLKQACSTRKHRAVSRRALHVLLTGLSNIGLQLFGSSASRGFTSEAADRWLARILARYQVRGTGAPTHQDLALLLPMLYAVAGPVSQWGPRSANALQGLLLAHRTLAYQLHMKRLSVMPSAASCLSAGSSNGAVARQTTMQQRVAVQLADEVRDHRAMMQALRTLGVTLPTLSSRVRKQLAQRVKRTMVMRLEQRTQRRLRLATAAGTLAHPQLGHAQGQRVPSHPS